MAERAPYAAADVPYVFDRCFATGSAARGRTEEPRLARDYDRYENNINLTFPHPRFFHPGQDLRCSDHGLQNQRRALFPSLDHQYGDLDPGDYGRRELPYHGPPPYDVADEELGFGRRGRHLSYSPPPYDATDERLQPARRGRRPIRSPPRYDAADTGVRFDWGERRPNPSLIPYAAIDNDFILDHERHGHLPRDRLSINRLPFHSRDMGLDNIGERPFRDINTSPRDHISRRGLHESHDMSSDHWNSLGLRPNLGMEPGPNDYGDNFESSLHRHRGDFESLEDSLEHYDYHSSYHEAHVHRPHGPLRTEHRSDLDSRSVCDDKKDKLIKSLQAQTAAKSKYLQSLVQMQDELDAVDRRKAQLEKRYTQESIKSKPPGRGRRDKRAHKSRATKSGPAANLLSRNLEELLPSERTIPFRPRQPRVRQTSRLDKRADSIFATFPGCNAQQHPPYDSMIPAQVATRTQTQLATDATRPPSAAVSPSSTAESPFEKNLRCQNNLSHAATPQLDDGNTSHDGAEVIDHSNNNDNLSASSQESPVDHTAHISQTEAHDALEGSDSSDSGCDTPDGEEDGFEILDVGVDDEAEGGAVREMLVRIEL